MNHRFEYDGQEYEAELDVDPGIPPTPPSMGEPGDPGEGPSLELTKLWRIVGGEHYQVGAESRGLWREMEKFLNEDVEHILGKARDDARSDEGERRFDADREG